MKKYIKSIGLVLLGFGITLGLMYVDSKSKVLNESEIKNSKQMTIMIEEDGEYKESKTISKTGYKYNEEKSYCNNGAKPTWNSITNSLKLSNLTKDKTSCILYFDKKLTKTSEEVLADLGRTIATEEPDFSTTDEEEHIDENGKSKMFKTEDDFGDSYYFRGKVDDNWVQFGHTGTDNMDETKIWWRIIRINGDGSIRIIYAGTGSSTSTFTSNGYTGTTSSMIEVEGANSGTNKYYYSTSNGDHLDNKYVGYYYDDNNAHGNTTPSYVAQKVNLWFSNNLKDELEASDRKIDQNVGFCGDRSNSTSNSSEWPNSITDDGGIATTTTYYGGFLRLHNKKNPVLTCSTSNHKKEDTFMYKSTTSTFGTKSLQYPVGLITADEVVFAGSLYNTENNQYYLYNGQNYWTMSPYDYYSGGAYVFCVNYNGGINATM